MTQTHTGLAHTVLVTFKPKPEYQDKFAHLMQSVKEELPQVDGCLGVVVMSSREEAGVFTVLEDWRDATAHAAQLQRLTQSGDMAHILGMLREAPGTVIVDRI